MIRVVKCARGLRRVLDMVALALCVQGTQESHFEVGNAVRRAVWRTACSGVAVAMNKITR